MKHTETKVTFQPSGRQVYVLPGTILLEAAAQAGLILQTPCGGGGTCGKCRVRVTAGACPPSDACRATLGYAAVAAGDRLACQARVKGDVTIEVPATSLFETDQKILTGTDTATGEIQPAIVKRHVALPPPTQEDARTDIERLRDALAPVAIRHFRLDTVRVLPRDLRRLGFTGTAVVVDGELTDFEAGDTTAHCHGVAFDVGTTTVVGTLVNLTTGLDLAVEARINPQTSQGDDVISRIQKCRESQQGLAQLQRVIVSALNEIIDALVTKAGINRNTIYEIVLAGNTAMQQIACGIDPSALGELPFVPAFRDALHLKASALNLDIHPNGRVFVFSQIGGFVGGDTVAGVVASRLDQEPGTALLIDIGTNGEIVLAHQGRLTATSVAAGPAFEGARISCGMRATSGAIEKVALDGDVRLNILNNARPAGLCGSGLIDAAAELLRTGILDSSGRFVEPDDLPATLPKALQRRVLLREGQGAFVLATAAESATGAPLLLTQRDIRELQLAVAAIRAGVTLLLRQHQVTPAALDTVLVAGGFGNFIRRNHARRLGLLPAIPCERIRFIGNASLLGAKRALLSVAEKTRSDEIACRATHVDLSLLPEFQEEFGNAMEFPADDGGAC